MSSELATVSDCSASQYCTASDQALNYGGQYIVHWNNKFSPLNSQSLVTVSVYSTYDLTTPIFQRTNIDNENGMISLQPDAEWFSRYTGSSSAAGENQTIFFAVYLQGNDPPAANQMLQLNLTATPEQYQQIQQILHPSTTASSSASDSASDAARSSSTGASSSGTQTQTDTASDAASQTDTDSDLQSNDDSTLEMELLSSGELRTDISSALESSSDTDGNDSGGDKRGLSDGAIAGIAVGSAVGFLLLLLLVLLPLYLRRRRSKRLLTKTGGVNGGGDGGSEESASSEQEIPAMAMALPAAARRAGDAEKRQHLDTPLLVGNRPNNSFTSHDDASTYQPLSLESPRVLVHMPSSTRSAVAGAAGSPGPDAGSPGPADAGLSTDDARQIGDIFRDALRKPPPISDDDDDLHDDDPGWRERVANERMQRELEQEASVIRSVAMRAQGSGDLSSSKSSP